MTKDEYLKKIGSEIGKLINTSGMSQTEIAELSGVDRSEISAFISKGKRITSIYKINAILKALGFKLDITKENPTHTIEIPDEDYQDLQAFIDEIEHDPQYKEYRETMKRLFPS